MSNPVRKLKHNYNPDPNLEIIIDDHGNLKINDYSAVSDLLSVPGLHETEFEFFSKRVGRRQGKSQL